jgi:hypothetical protein
MPPLASLPSPESPEAIGWLLLGIAAIAVVWEKVAAIIDRYRTKESPTTRIDGQPIEVKAAGEFVDRKLYDRDREEMRQELSRNASARKTNYERLEQLGCEISATQAEVSKQGETIAEIVQVSRETGSKVDAVGGQLTVINQQVQQISNSLIVAAHERRHS